jgi:hypothetical protein
MPHPTRRNEVVLVDQRLAAVREEIATREQALKNLRERIDGASGKREGARSTARQIVAAGEAVIAELTAERDRLTRET